MSDMNKNPEGPEAQKPRKAPSARGAKMRAAFRTRAFRMGTYSVAVALVVIAIVFAVNLVMTKVPATVTQIDMTDQGIFTLAEQTKSVVASLDSPVTVYWIVQQGQEDGQLGKLLALYEGLGKNLSVVKKDPVVYPGFAKQYTDSDVSNNSLIVVCGTRSKLVANSDIYVYDYDEYYSSGNVTGTFCGESALTGAISYVTSAELPVIYTLEGHGETALSSDMSKALTDENYTTQTLSLVSETEVPEDCDALLIVGPKTDLAPLECDALRAYLKNGGKVLLFTDYVKGGLPNLEAVLADYGVTDVQGVVLEGDKNYCAWGYSYYLLPDIGSHTITSPLSSNGYSVIAPVATGLQIAADLRDGLTVESLLTTSTSSYCKLAGTEMKTYNKETGDVDGPFSIGVAITDDLGDDKQAQIVWYSTSQILDDTVNGWVGGANQDLFLNSLGWMCAQENSVSIRSKNLSTSYLTVSDAVSSSLSVLLIGVVPLAVLAAGVIVVVRRKRR